MIIGKAVVLYLNGTEVLDPFLRFRRSGLQGGSNGDGAASGALTGVEAAWRIFKDN